MNFKTELLEAIAMELRNKSSLRVESSSAADSKIPILNVRKLGSKKWMRLCVIGDVLMCNLASSSKGEEGFYPISKSGCGGRINLNDPDAMDQLLAILKRDLRK